MKALLSSDNPLVYQLEGSALVTSLPYIDEPLEKKDLQLIRKMITLEAEEVSQLSDDEKVEILDEDIETPFLDRFVADLPSLGKRVEGRVDKLSKYETAVLEAENLKEKYHLFQAEC